MELQKDTRFETVLTDAGLSAKAEDGAGWIEGYASIFNNLDQQREVVRPGCWAKSVAERVPAGKVKLMVRHYAHGGDTLECIGTVSQGKEDDRGLWFHADLSSVQMAQDIRQKVQEGHIGYSSVGYQPVEWGEIAWEDGKSAVELTQAKWLETTLTNMPANELAVLTAAKAILADSGAPEAGRALSEVERSRIAGVLREMDVLGKALNTLLSEPTPDAERAKALLAVHADLKSRREWLELQHLSV